MAAVAVDAALKLSGPSRQRAPSRLRWVVYVVLGGAAAATIGAWLVLVLLACGAAELIWRGAHPRALQAHGWPALLAAAPAVGGLGALSWVASKVGALSYGGGFVIIPLMQADAVDHYHWMTNDQFLSAVALGQVTPGPVVADGGGRRLRRRRHRRRLARSAGRVRPVVHLHPRRRRAV